MNNNQNSSPNLMVKPQDQYEKVAFKNDYASFLGAMSASEVRTFHAGDTLDEPVSVTIVSQ